MKLMHKTLCFHGIGKGYVFEEKKLQMCYL
jgi:hypothetical protein